MLKENKLLLKNRVGFKVFLIVVVQLAIAIPLFIIGGLLLYGIVNKGSIIETIVSIIFFLVSLYLSLLILSKKFIPRDINDVSKWTGIVYLASGTVYLIISVMSQSFNILNISTQLVIYPLMGYFEIKIFLQRKFSSTSK